MLNLLLGRTFLGWVGALIWPMCEKPVQKNNVGFESLRDNKQDNQYDALVHRMKEQGCLSPSQN
jgi:hypothetical protein